MSSAIFYLPDEMSNVTYCDVSLNVDHMAVHTSSSKTDQYHQCDYVIVARTNTRTCPVVILECTMATLSKLLKLQLFCGIVMSRSGDRLRSQGSQPFEGAISGKISRTRIHNLGFIV